MTIDSMDSGHVNWYHYCSQEHLCLAATVATLRWIASETGANVLAETGFMMRSAE